MMMGINQAELKVSENSYQDLMRFQERLIKKNFKLAVKITKPCGMWVGESSRLNFKSTCDTKAILEDVKFLFNNQDTFLESSRGGPREWASLDNLNKWFRTHSIFKYLINMSPGSLNLMQQSLALTTENLEH